MSFPMVAEFTEGIGAKVLPPKGCYRTAFAPDQDR